MRLQTLAERTLTAEAAFQDRVQGRPQLQAVTVADEMDRGPLQRHAHDAAARQQLGQLVALKCLQPRPERDVRHLRLLRLEADEVFDHLQGRAPLPAQEELAFQQRAIECVAGENLGRGSVGARAW